MNTIANLALFSHDSELSELLIKKSVQYAIPIAQSTDDHDFYLAYVADDSAHGFYCRLHKSGKQSPGALQIDFTQGKAAHRRQFGDGRKQTLARAVGIKGAYNPRVLDTCAGLGRDAFVIACLGCHVTLLERNPVIYELLDSALAHAREDKTIGEMVNERMQLIYSPASHYLDKLEAPLCFDTIYLDPMYPPRDKSAQVKKEMQYFHAIVGADDDASETLSLALALKPKRIVVKRPNTAAALGQHLTQNSVSSKNTRYDIYT